MWVPGETKKVLRSVAQAALNGKLPRRSLREIESLFTGGEEMLSKLVRFWPSQTRASGGRGTGTPQFSQKENQNLSSGSMVHWDVSTLCSSSIIRTSSGDRLVMVVSRVGLQGSDASPWLRDKLRRQRSVNATRTNVSNQMRERLSYEWWWRLREVRCWCVTSEERTATPRWPWHDGRARGRRALVSRQKKLPKVGTGQYSTVP